MDRTHSPTDKGVIFTPEIEAIGGGERDLHEMGVLELAVAGEVVDDGDALGLVSGFGPDSCPLRASISGGGLSPVPP